MLERATTAAGGRIGATAGKPVKIDTTTGSQANGAQLPLANSAPGYPGFGPATTGEGMPASSGGLTRHNRPAYKSASASLTPQPVSPSAPPLLLPIHHAGHADLLALQPGTARRDVIAKLGAPASIVTIPDDGHLLEIFKYVSANRWLGTVRLDNGLVVNVDAAQ